MYHFRSNPPSRQIASEPPSARADRFTRDRVDLLPRIKRLLSKRGMAPTAFGRMVASDPRLVADLENGRRLTDRLHNRIEKFLDTADAWEVRHHA